MPAAYSLSEYARRAWHGSGCEVTEVPDRLVSCGNLKRKREQVILLADIVSGDVAETALRGLAELIVAASLLADHKFAAVVARIKPHRVRHRASIGAIEVNPRSQFDKGTALGQLGRLFVFDANPGGAQPVLLRGDRTDQNLIAAGGGPDLPPIPRREHNHSHQQHRSQHHGDRNQ